MGKRLLLISNSTNPGEKFLDYTRKYITAFLGKGIKTIAFVPYAATNISFSEYTKPVNDVFAIMGYKVYSLANHSNPSEVILNTDAIVVGGGNTFYLLHHLQVMGLLEPIRQKVENSTPFIGWSAGANVACPTIMTTNDMPIIQPSSFESLGLVPFQINPHYTDGCIPNHNGETREDRIREFLDINPRYLVVGLRERSMLRVEANRVMLLGNKTIKIFRKGMPSLEYEPSSSIDFILKPV